MFAIAATFEIKADDMERFLPLMLENARTSMADERGCQQFDVCTDPGAPGIVFLYEIYDDRAAFEAHLDSPHYASFDQASAPMVLSKHVDCYEKVQR